jgi:rod shape-determining protein MreC
VWYWRDGTKKISNLEGRLSQVSVDYAQLRSLEEENKALRQIKGIQDKTEFGGGITAKLIKLDQGYGLNVGGIDGVKSGMVVVDDEGVLVGLVETSTTRTSNLLMPEEEGVRLSVRVVGEKTTGVLVGDGRNAVFREVLQAEPLKVGDVLVTTGADGNYPEGLVVGQVVQLVGNASDVTKAAMVDFLYDPTSMVVVGE